jgi:molybdate transport system substrate-binding protein
MPFPLLRSLGLIAVLALPSGLAGTPASAQQGPPIAAASDLQFALDEVAAAFLEETGQPVRITYGSSGTFAAQLRQGAPFELFLSADEGFVFMLADAGLTRDRGTLYAQGRIVLFSPTGSPLVPDEGLDGLERALDDGIVSRFAIANPEHAPYGRAAEQALRTRGLWERVEPHLVLGENVSQAAQFATTGSAQGGIIAYSLALAPSFEPMGSFALIPEDWHEPLLQRMVLMKNAGEEATAFHDYLQTEPARAVLRRYGFVLPDEESPAP